MNRGFLSWIWLLCGAVLLPFTAWQTVIPAAAWLAPIFLLRFTRISRRPGTALHLVFLAYSAGTLIASRGLPFDLLGLFGNVLFKGLVWTLPYATDRFAAERLKGWKRAIVFPSAFVAADWALSLLNVSSSGSPAYSQAGNLALLQILAITGMWGVTFLIMWFASIANGIWQEGFQWRTLRGHLAVFVATLMAVLLYGNIRLNFASPSSRTVEVATITMGKDLIPSVDWMKFGQSTDLQRSAVRPKLQATVTQMLARSETALRGGAKVVSWQESSAWVLEEDRQEVLDKSADLARRFEAYLQISLEVFTRTPKLPYLRDQSILIGPSGSVLWTYDKTHLVPYDEAFITIAGPGKLPEADSPNGRLSTAICYDTYFPALLRQAGKLGTDILFAPTNDVSPYSSSALAMATSRAIENGFSVIRPTGHGLSAVIDYQGRLLGSEEYSTTTDGIMLTDIPTRGTVTLYGRIGDVFAYLCIAVLALLSALAVLGRRESI
jgi:apolipoprotein N-acyltransferase